jgi:hypothetical protein
MRNAERGFLPAVLLVAGSAIGQQTWIVDANSGPGTHFTNLQPAVNAAAAGDRILVRAGVYTPCMIGKALTIVGSPNAVVAGSGGYVPGFLVGGIGAGSVLSIAGLRLATTGISPTSLAIQNCAGTVIFDDVHVTQSTMVLGVADWRCNRCTFDQTIVAGQSICTFDRSTLQGGLYLYYSAHAELNRCTVTGSASAIHLANGESLVLRDDGSRTIATTSSSPAIIGTGLVVIDPHVVLQTAGSTPIAPSLNVVVRAMPSLAIAAGPPGGSVDVDLFGPPGEAFFEFLGFAAAPVLEPLTQDLVWLQPVLLWDLGTFAPSGRHLTQIPLPNVPEIVGITWSWQAVVAGPTTGLALSNCVSYVHPSQ